MVACLEVAPTTGQVHIHCYIWFRDNARLDLNRVQGAHVDVCKGKPYQVKNYVKKDGNIIYEMGEEPEEPKTKHRKGPTIKEVKQMTPEQIEEQPANQISHIQKILNMKRRQLCIENRRYEKVKVHWLWGPTGTGKSREAFESGAIQIDYSNSFFSDWFDSKNVLFDDFRGKIPYEMLLKLTDGYRGSVPINIKGDYLWWDVDEIWITSPYHPERVYRQQNLKDDKIEQLLRRITDLRYTGPEGLNIDMNDSD